MLEKAAISRTPTKEKITIDSFELLNKVGKGTFGEVFEAVLIKEKEIFATPKKYALKAIKKRMLVHTGQMKYAISEWTIMKRLNHPFIVGLHYAFQNTKYLYLAMDYWPGKDLSVHLDTYNYFPEEIARFFIAEVILAIEYIHKNDIIYRDLKPNNILLDADGHIKITDFGLAKEGMVGMDSTNTFCGSPAYLAPELIKEKKFNKASDIYQIGVTLYEFLTGGPPFFQSNRDELFDKIQNSYELKVPKHVSPTSIDLLGQLLNKIPSKRLGVENYDDLKAHKFFEEIQWDKLLKKEHPYDVSPFTLFQNSQNNDHSFDDNLAGDFLESGDSWSCMK